MNVLFDVLEKTEVYLDDTFIFLDFTVIILDAAIMDLVGFVDFQFELF